jgi:hypothetical protein
VSIVLLIGLGYSTVLLVPRLRSHHLPGNQQGYEPVQPLAFSHRQHAGELQIACLYCHGGAETSRHAGTPAASVCMNCHRAVTAPRDAVRAEDDLARAEKRASIIASATGQAGGLPNLWQAGWVAETMLNVEKRKPRPIVSPELQKLYDSLALDDKLRPIPGQAARPIAWVRVHRLPDHAYFDHRAHVSAGVACQRCHGAVETMDRVRQVEDLSMGWCVNCHRDVSRTGLAGKEVQAATDCSTCHR